MVVWPNGNIAGLINVVDQRRDRLVLRWVTDSVVYPPTVSVA